MSNLKESKYFDEAIRVIEIEAQAVLDIKKTLNQDFKSAIQAILASKGRVIVCGMGKSGHIARKIFATFVSTGTPSFYLHPGEAFHGDLGMILPNDIFLALSNSGETEEIIRLIPFVKENGNLLISITGNESSTLAKNSDFHICVSVKNEACPLNLAPTSSTTAVLVMGDVLAIILMKARGFQAKDFALFHPGGSLGRKLLGKVGNYLKELLFIDQEANFETIVSSLTKSSIGVIGVGTAENLMGMITDGDLRRCFSICPRSKILEIKAQDIMTKNPVTISSETSCYDAHQMMDTMRINSLIVIKDDVVVGLYDNLNK
ncbi:MAG: KpsF/GutQ family sugar-phosphate isomerase [Limnospira sp. PMC 1234.20]|uniref:KpsF/GutQ family sugar-phosphate isomerase n=1 Tax=Limnospira sp. PMC 1234.20 TaxID=2981032 RepID=UPI0028E10D66|nr:KpsF/GutQ family sugar-phosphate isomerase [Limnospira sp. PMC 1234.20]MDT9270901.1 KpsF/GutQ family sugar-phosphate isomerase [Limnospira sp. PMC 1234.20]